MWSWLFSPRIGPNQAEPYRLYPWDVSNVLHIWASLLIYYRRIRAYSNAEGSRPTILLRARQLAPRGASDPIQQLFHNDRRSVLTGPYIFLPIGGSYFWSPWGRNQFGWESSGCKTYPLQCRAHMRQSRECISSPCDFLFLLDSPFL